MEKSTIWTPANVVTILRVALVPAWLALAETQPPTDGSAISVGALLSAALFVLLALTGKLDGYLARSRGEVTTFGKFLDPIADKLVVIVALCFLLEHGLVNSWVLLLVVAREFLVSGLRMVVAAKGTVIAASSLGKWKTATTMVSLSVLLVLRALPAGPAAQALWWVGYVTLAAALVITAWSGIDYFVKSWPAIAEAD